MSEGREAEDNDLKARLRVRAVQHGRSMQEEVRLLLRQALSASPDDTARPLSQLAESLFGAHHGIELATPKREPARAVPASN